MADNALREDDKRRFINKVVEALTPDSMTDLFEEEIRSKWNAYVLSLCQDADPNRLFTTYLCFQRKDSKEGPCISGVYFMQSPCIHFQNGVMPYVDIDQCPDAGVRTAVEASLDYERRRDELKALLTSRLLTTNTRMQLKAQLPRLYAFFDEGSATAENMPVAVDMEAFGDEPIAV